MDLETLRTYCLAKKGVEEGLPFGEDTLVFKVMGKLFALTSINTGKAVNLKCDPDRAIQLREEYSEIIPGFHMNKRHWNTVALDGSLSKKMIFELIDHSYDLVFASLPKKSKEEWNTL
ncbi:MmcQ/YjbR family DNA-binding protein [soil metagenome]